MYYFNDVIETDDVKLTYFSLLKIGVFVKENFLLLLFLDFIIFCLFIYFFFFTMNTR